MASTSGRTATKPRPRAGKRPKGPRYRRPPWYRWPGPWIALAVALAAGMVLLLSPIGDGGGGSGTEPYVGGDLHSLAVDPATGRLYVGGHGGVAVSTDGGSTWRQIDSLDGADAMGWAFTGERVLVGGHPGISASTDGGSIFEQRNQGLPATDIHALGGDEGILYAGSPQVGILTSEDGGETWDVVTDQAGQSFMGRILVDPEDPTHLMAPDMASGAAESTDGGRTWSALGGVSGAMWVSWDPADTDHVTVSAIGQAAESTDGGATWQQLQVPEGASIVEIDPEDPARLYAGVHEGENALVWTSTDGGRSWKMP